MYEKNLKNILALRVWESTHIFCFCLSTLVFGVVHCSEDFYEQHKVVNGCSDVFVEVFGKERGMHARSA